MHSACLTLLFTLREGCPFPQVYRWGNGGTGRLNNFPTSRSTAGTLPRALWVPQTPLPLQPALLLSLSLWASLPQQCGGAGGVPPPLGTRVPAAALDTAASELNLRHLPAQSTFNLDSSAPVIGPGPGHPQPGWLVGPLPPPQTKAGFIVVRKLSETLWAAFVPSHLPQTSGGPSQGHPLMVFCTLGASVPAPALSQTTA